MSPILKPYGHQLGANLLPNGRHLGAKSGRSWSQLVLGRCWPKLTPSRANVADMPDRNGASGRFWTNLQNVQMTTITCTGQGGHGLKLYRSDRSVRFLSTPKLTRLGTFGVRIDLHFVWQAWHSWHWAGSGGALGPRWCHGCSFVWQAWHFEASTSILCGRRGTWCNCL
jgi:hypothetical protein